MSATTLVITVLMATVASASFWDNDDDAFNAGMNFKPLPLPPFPSLPGFPNLSFPTLNFPTIPNPLNNVQWPTVESVASQQGDPGSNYVGAAVVSHSTGTRDDDGNIVRKTSSTMLVNNNGDVVVQKTDGNNPPVIITQKAPVPFSDFAPPKFPKMSAFKSNFPTPKPFVFKQPIFEPIVFRPIDRDSIRQRVPQKGEKYQGQYHSVSSFQSNVNGVVTSGGESSSTLNDNGKVDNTDVGYRKGPK